MLLARNTRKQPRRNSDLRRPVGTLRAKTTNASENLIDFVKVLDKIEVTPEKLIFNSKFMLGPDGSKIEY